VFFADLLTVSLQFTSYTWKNEHVLTTSCVLRNHRLQQDRGICVQNSHDKKILIDGRKTPFAIAALGTIPRNDLQKGVIQQDN
jgi:hypothetical protein